MHTENKHNITVRTGFSRLAIPASVGVYDEEHKQAQTILISLSLEYPAPRIRLLASEDKYEHVFDYAQAADLVRGVCAEKHHEVIENLAMSMLVALQRNFPDVHGIHLELQKPDAVIGSAGAFCEVTFRP